MKTNWKWILGGAFVLALLAAPLLWSVFTPYRAYPMMGYGYGWHMPMMYGGYGMMGFGMFLMWLIPLGLLILIGLGIAVLARQLKAEKQ